MKNTEFKICNDSGEDPTCSDKFLVDLDVVNHLNYMKYDYLVLITACYLWLKLKNFKIIK